MGRPLTLRNSSRRNEPKHNAWQRCVWQGLALAGLLAAAAPAHAYRHAACLMMGRIEHVERQPLQEVLLRVQLQGVSDNNVHPNEVECAKIFRVGSRLWVSLHSTAFADARLPQKGEQAWLSLRYTSTSSALRKYEWITRQAYMERKDGIQRQSD